MTKKQIEIGIIGGCMTCQIRLGISNLFHRILARRLSEELNIESKTVIEVYHEFNRIPELFSRLLKDDGLDILILQLRPSIYTKRATFLTDNKRGKYIVNPILLNPGNAGKLERISMLKNPIKKPIKLINNPVKLRVTKKILKNNVKIGNLFLLKKRAKKYVLRTILGIHKICAERNIELIVIGILNPISKEKNDLFFDLNSYLKSNLSKHEITYLDVFSTMKQGKKLFYNEDMYHLSKNGHEMIAGLLFEKIKNNYELND